MHFRCEQKCSSRMWWRTNKAGDSHLQVQDKLQNRKQGGPWKMGRFWEGWRVCLHPLEEVTSIAQLQFQPTAGAFSQAWGAPLSVVTWGRIPVLTWRVSSRLWLGLHSGTFSHKQGPFTLSKATVRSFQAEDRVSAVSARALSVMESAPL